MDSGAEEAERIIAIISFLLFLAKVVALFILLFFICSIYSRLIKRMTCCCFVSPGSVMDTRETTISSRPVPKDSFSRLVTVVSFPETIMFAINGGGADRPTAAADKCKVGIPVLNKYETGQTHVMAPSAICPSNRNAIFPNAEISNGICAVRENTASTL